MTNEDYSEKVIEILCEKIDELEKEIKDLKTRFGFFLPDNTTSISWTKLNDDPNTTSNVTHSVICQRCGSYPCNCNYYYYRTN
jgi:hypothetical protein